MARFSLRFRLVATDSPPGIRRSGRSLAGRGATALLALCLFGQSARGEQDWVEDEPRWIPSFRFGFQTFGYGTEATVTNHINQPKNAGTQNDTSSLFMLGLGGELMGPMLDEGFPGRPRLFVQGGVQFKPFSSDSVFEIDVPGDAQSEVTAFQSGLANRIAAQSCDLPGASVPCPLIPQSFLGEGSTIDAEFQNLSWSGALGVAFTFPIADSLLLELKPSIAYNIDRIDMSGILTTVVDTGRTVDAPNGANYRGPRNNPDPRMGVVQVPEWLVYQSQASERITQHSLGPGLELGLVLFRSMRPVRASLYADARFLWLLGDRTTTFSDSVATYEVRRDPFEIRGGAGARLSWVGFGGR